MDVGKNTTSSDGDTAQKLVELLIVADGELNVSGDNTGPLVVASGIASKLEDLSGQVLHDGSEVHGGTTSDTRSVAALAQEARDTADGELKPSAGGPGGRLG